MRFISGLTGFALAQQLVCHLYKGGVSGEGTGSERNEFFEFGDSLGSFGVIVFQCDDGFESFLSTLPEQDVIALAHELGVGSSKATSTKKARDGIRKRIQESLLLTFEKKKDTA
jgi:hypothetical protein